MVDGPITSASTTASNSPKENRGLRTRVLLTLAMAGIIAGTTVVSVLAIRQPLQALFVRSVSSDLDNSIATFAKFQAERLVALDRENALLADLPDLRALMTTNDERTIDDGAVRFWKLSGSDLFALADTNGHIVAAFNSASSAGQPLRKDLRAYVSGAPTPFLVSGNHLFGCSVRPIYFGSQSEGTVLGYVISGFAIDRAAVEQLSQATGVNASFLSGDLLLASSFKPALETQMSTVHVPAANHPEEPFKIVLGGESYLAVVRILSMNDSVPLRLIELKSLNQEERTIRQIDRIVLSAGLLALVLGTALMFLLSRAVTRPLEELAAGVRAFAEGDSAYLLPYRGTREVRELSAAFGGMRKEILQANQSLLESERLATIGRMASSVSHDLRHYLAAVYANAEFLATGNLTIEDRNEILGEIRSAVNGTTDLLESLLIISRSGPGIRRSQYLVASAVEKVMGMIHAHPDAAGVQFSVHLCNPDLTSAVIDATQVERAVFNLLLNACQAPRSTDAAPTVSIDLEAYETEVVIEVTDNGDGVPVGIRNTLFDPFISEGKQKGSGLGLTLTQCIAVEHGGNVTLVRSSPGETVFRMSITRSGDAPLTLTSTRTEMEML
ncbi:MAG: ATP-binding protein [Terracidiphilus sp.]|jgi:signal transduction histidine kinase